MQRVKVKKGQLICKENSDGDNMYIIENGKVDVFKTINAQKVKLSTFSDHEFFGEMCLLLGKKRSATVQAVEDTVLDVLSKQDFLEKIQNDREFALRIMTSLANRVLGAHDIICELEGAKKSLEIMYKSKQVII